MFDLNISNYTDAELRDLIGVNILANNETILQKINQTKLNINTDPKLNASKKNEIYDFLNKVYNKISVPQNNMYNDTLIQMPSIEEGFKSETWKGRTVDASIAPPGYLNQINVHTIKKSVNIDTRFRPNYYNSSSTDFSITLPIKLSKVVSMRIASMEIPMTFYVISKKNMNSYFRLQFSNYTETDLTKRVHIYTIITIPDGNYELNWQDVTTSTDITQMINSYINASITQPVWAIRIGLDDSMATNLFTFDTVIGYAHQNDPTFPDITAETLEGLRFNVDRTSGKGVFSYVPEIADDNKKQFTVIWGINEYGQIDLTTNLQFHLGWILGFRVNEYTGYSIVSEGIFYCKGPRYGFISINDFQNSGNDYFISAYSSSVLRKDIIARVNLTSIQQSEGIYQSGQDDGFSNQTNRQRSYFGPVTIEKLEIKLLDEYGRIIDLNNMDWSMSLMFECVYS